MEEVIDIGYRHYESLSDFMKHVNDHDYFDSVLAVQEFHQHANIIKSENAVITLYAMVVYSNQQTEKMLYRSKEPIEVRIDTDDLNSIYISGLPSSFVSKFSTKTELMNYSYGVLTIEGKDASNTPYIVSLISE